MADNHALEQLLEILDRKAFEPVLKASPEDFKSEHEKQKLLRMKETTRSTQQRYHQSYSSPSEVVQKFRRDLTSDESMKVQAELRSLGLPTLQDVKYEFNTAARELGIRQAPPV